MALEYGFRMRFFQNRTDWYFLFIFRTLKLRTRTFYWIFFSVYVDPTTKSTYTLNRLMKPYTIDVGCAFEDVKVQMLPSISAVLNHVEMER